MSSYAFDNGWQQARRRLGLLEECFDPASFRRLDQLGISLGWQCLEIGGGAGSVTQWLCSQVGSAGRVVATDLDTRFLKTLNEPNLEIWQHNLVTDELPRRQFDLVHSRLVLMHLPEREEIISRLIAALKPGGWLLLEELDLYPVMATASGAYERVLEGFKRCTEEVGMASEWARGLPDLLTRSGLHEVAAETETPMFCGSATFTRFLSLSFTQLRDQILATGVDKQAFDDTQVVLADPTQWFTGPANVVAWGRRPAEPRPEPSNPFAKTVS